MEHFLSSPPPPPPWSLDLAAAAAAVPAAAGSPAAVLERAAAAAGGILVFGCWQEAGFFRGENTISAEVRSGGRPREEVKVERDQDEGRPFLAKRQKNDF